MTVAVWLFTAGNMRGWVYRRAIFAASVASLARTKGVLPCMLVQTRLAANGMRNISVFVLFVGTNGEVRLRFATPDVFAGGLRSSTVRGRARVGVVQPSLIPPAVL